MRPLQCACIASSAIAIGSVLTGVTMVSANPAKGIWKSAIPRTQMKGEFGSHDPVGLMNGQFIKADCSINWTDPDSNKLYCFSTPTSMDYFRYWPKKNAKLAGETWEQSKKSH